ncbi:MAG: signal peptidase II [Cyclobacteriaceae bacterium]
MMMKQPRLSRTLLILSLVIVNIGCDQVSKSIVRERVAYHDYIEVIQDRLTLTKVENSGAFLGMGSDLHPGLRNTIMLILPALALLTMLFLLIFKSGLTPTMIFGLCLMVGGGFGNVIDRIRYGSVTDFLHIDFGFFQTGIFNLADVSIMIGAILLFGYTLTHKKEADPHA